MDSEDQRKRLALALYGDIRYEPTTEGELNVMLCLLHMEEDKCESYESEDGTRCSSSGGPVAGHGNRPREACERALLSAVCIAFTADASGHVGPTR